MGYRITRIPGIIDDKTVAGGDVFEHILFVSTTAPDADYDNIPDAVSDASVDDAIWLDAETFTITSNLAVNKKLHFFGIPGATKITLATENVSTIFNTSNGTTFFGIEIENTAEGADSACIVTNRDIDLSQCTLTKTGAATRGYGIWIFTNAITSKLDNVRISSTGATTNHGIKTDSATALTISGGEYIATNNPINLNHVGSTIVVQGDPVIGISTTVNMDASNTIVTSNASGLTANFGDIGLLDEAGDYDDTATAGDNVTWCIALTDSINNAQILVKRRGNAIVNYRVAGGAPTAGHFLVTSTAAGEADKQETMHPAVLAVATANGAAGKVAVQLLTGTATRIFTDTNDTVRLLATSDSDFTATINGAPVGADVTYTLGSGSGDTINVLSPAQVGKIVLHNTVGGRTPTALIDDCAPPVITLTAGAPGDWVHGDTIQARSTTVAGALPGVPTVFLFDLDLSGFLPELVRSAAFTFSHEDNAPSAAVFSMIHEFNGSPSFGVGDVVQCSINNINALKLSVINIFDKTICFAVSASGASTSGILIRIRSIDVAVP